MKLTFQLKLTTDYHIGAGHGLGAEVDAALLRDSDGLPVLRGSALTGLLRDGMWRLLQTPPLTSHFAAHQAEMTRRADAVAAWCEERQTCPLCRVFGTPAAPKRWRIASARPDGAQQFLSEANAWQAGQTGAQVAARVRVNPRLRRAEERKLFKQEEGDAQLVFTFTAECADDARTLDEAAWLTAAARMVRRLGSARRRGRGECVIQLLKAEAEQVETLPEALRTQAGLLGHFKAWLDGAESRPQLNAAARSWQTPVATQAEEASATPVRRWLLLRLDEPVLVAKRAQAGNEFETLEHIPGALLLGALAGQAAAQWKLATADVDGALYRTFVETFKNGAVRFGGLHPARANDSTVTATIPAPLDWLTCKAYWGEEHGMGVNKFRAGGYAKEEASPTNCPACAADGHADVPLVHFDGFHSVESKSQHLTASRREEIHPRNHPQTQRVARGNLFGYVALESGQFFLGELWCRDAAAWATLLKLIGLAKEDEAFSLRLGKATRRGYGAVSARLLKPRQGQNVEAELVELDLWRGLPIESRVTDGADRLTFTLLSDAIVPDAWGRMRQTFDVGYLQQLIGAPFVNAADTPLQTFCQARPVDNFNNQLGLPRWRDAALKAGSAVGIRLQSPPADPLKRERWFTALRERLRHIEAEGIGLRRHEGFGQVVFNHPLYAGEAGLSVNTAIDLPSAWRPVQSHSGGYAKTARAAEKAVTNWEEGRLQKFRHELFRAASTPTNEEEKNWLALARWLHNVAAWSIADLQEQLATFGEPSLLTDVFTTAPRDKENYFAKAANQPALAYLQELLREVETKNHEDELRRTLVESLAQRLADTVRKGESE